MADTSWITCPNGLCDRGKALWLDQQKDRSLGTAFSFGYTQHLRNTLGCNRANANRLPCRDDSSLDRVQTAGALLDRPLQHMQVTSGRGVDWHTTSAANTVYDPD
eukprot:694980-Rhodomonas_salina.2